MPERKADVVDTLAAGLSLVQELGLEVALKLNHKPGRQTTPHI
jgi:hypothetical protein